jgi:hypothetical protein
MRGVRRSALSLLLASALCALAALAAAAAAPVAPLSSLGALKPAPAPGPLGPEGVPIPKAAALGEVRAVALGEKIDGIECQARENVAYHVHAHLTIFVDGHAAQIPYGVGIGPPLEGVNTTAGPFVELGSCFMWLHTHAADGIIHIESPTTRTYTLGQFFAIWGQPLSAHRLGPASGKVVAFLNGKVWTGSPAAIPLTATAQIQLEVGSPLIAPEHITFPAGLATGMRPAAKK